jgi:hypothetical protein
VLTGAMLARPSGGVGVIRLSVVTVRNASLGCRIHPQLPSDTPLFIQNWQQQLLILPVFRFGHGR